MGFYINTDPTKLETLKSHLDHFSKNILAACNELSTAANKLRQAIDTETFRKVDFSVRRTEDVIQGSERKIHALTEQVNAYLSAMRQLRSICENYNSFGSGNAVGTTPSVQTTASATIATSASSDSVTTAQGVIIRAPRQNISRYSYTVDCENSNAFADYKIIGDHAWLSSLARQNAPRGTGSEMLKIVCNHAAASGAAYIRGEVTASDIRLNGYNSNGESVLLRFYQKHGFQVTPGEGGSYKIRKDL